MPSRGRSAGVDHEVEEKTNSNGHNVKTMLLCTMERLLFQQIGFHKTFFQSALILKGQTQARTLTLLPMTSFEPHCLFTFSEALSYLHEQ